MGGVVDEGGGSGGVLLTEIWRYCTKNEGGSDCCLQTNWPINELTHNRLVDEVAFPRIPYYQLLLPSRYAVLGIFYPSSHT